MFTMCIPLLLIFIYDETFIVNVDCAFISGRFIIMKNLNYFMIVVT